MLDDLGVGMRLKIVDKKMRIKTDASAARGMALRKGLGPVRHRGWATLDSRRSTLRGYMHRKRRREHQFGGHFDKTFRLGIT
jgi:hypothetical protein